MPADPRFYSQRALAYYAVFCASLGIADATHALNLDSNFAKAYCHRALAHTARGEMRLAVEDFLRVLETTADPALRRLADEGLAQWGFDACALHCRVW